MAPRVRLRLWLLVVAGAGVDAGVPAAEGQDTFGPGHSNATGYPTPAHMHTQTATALRPTTVSLTAAAPARTTAASSTSAANGTSAAAYNSTAAGAGGGGGHGGGGSDDDDDGDDTSAAAAVAAVVVVVLLLLAAGLVLAALAHARRRTETEEFAAVAGAVAAAGDAVGRGASEDSATDYVASLPRSDISSAGSAGAPEAGAGTAGRTSSHAVAAQQHRSPTTCVGSSHSDVRTVLAGGEDDVDVDVDGPDDDDDDDDDNNNDDDDPRERYTMAQSSSIPGGTESPWPPSRRLGTMFDAPAPAGPAGPGRPARASTVFRALSSEGGYGDGNGDGHGDGDGRAVLLSRYSMARSSHADAAPDGSRGGQVASRTLRPGDSTFNDGALPAPGKTALLGAATKNRPRGPARRPPTRGTVTWDGGGNGTHTSPADGSRRTGGPVAAAGTGAAPPPLPPLPPLPDNDGASAHIRVDPAAGRLYDRASDGAIRPLYLLELGLGAGPGAPSETGRPAHHPPQPPHPHPHPHPHPQRWRGAPDARIPPPALMRELRQTVALRINGPGGSRSVLVRGARNNHATRPVLSLAAHTIRRHGPTFADRTNANANTAAVAGPGPVGVLAPQTQPPLAMGDDADDAVGAAAFAVETAAVAGRRYSAVLFQCACAHEGGGGDGR